MLPSSTVENYLKTIYLGTSGPGAEPLQISVEEFTRLFHRSKAPVLRVSDQDNHLCGAFHCLNKRHGRDKMILLPHPSRRLPGSILSRPSVEKSRNKVKGNRYLNFHRGILAIKCCIGARSTGVRAIRAMSSHNKSLAFLLAARPMPRTMLSTNGKRRRQAGITTKRTLLCTRQMCRRSGTRTKRVCALAIGKSKSVAARSTILRLTRAHLMLLSRTAT